MKRLQLGAALMMVVFAFACFFSAPVMSDDELPWDADDGGSGENVGDDTTVVRPGDEEETSYNPPSGWESPWWLNLFLKFVSFSSDVIIADQANVQTISSGSGFDCGEAVSVTGEKMNTKAEHAGSMR